MVIPVDQVFVQMMEDVLRVVAALAVFVGFVLAVETVHWLTKGRSLMPVAVVQGEPERKDLKTCPPDGYVKIKRMSHGEKMERRAFSSKMMMEADQRSKSMRGEIDLFNEQAELYDFAHCIVEHNLTDVDGRPLEFKNPKDVKLLAGQVAEEISSYIDELNNFEDSDEVGNSSAESAPSS